MRDMTAEEVRDFLINTEHIANLATVRENGCPHVVPIWYWYDGTALYFHIWHESVKARNIRHNPNIAISIDREVIPYAFVMLEGQAEIIEITPEELLDYARKITGRYLTGDLVDTISRRNAVDGELLVRLQPSRIVARYVF